MVEGRYEPGPGGQRRFEFVGHLELWRRDAHLGIQECHGDYCYDDGEVADELTNLIDAIVLIEALRCYWKLSFTFEGKNSAFLKSFKFTESRNVPRNSKIDMRNTSALYGGTKHPGDNTPSIC